MGAAFTQILFICQHLWPPSPHPNFLLMLPLRMNRSAGVIAQTLIRYVEIHSHTHIYMRCRDILLSNLLFSCMSVKEGDLIVSKQQNVA